MSEIESWHMPVPMRLIDVADDARRRFGAEAAAVIFPNLPEHDWRFELALPDGSTATCAYNTTASQLAAYLKHHGVALTAADGGF
jgi:hypothetical protein